MILTRSMAPWQQFEQSYRGHLCGAGTDVSFC